MKAGPRSAGRGVWPWCSPDLLPSSLSMSSSWDRCRARICPLSGMQHLRLQVLQQVQSKVRMLGDYRRLASLRRTSVRIAPIDPFRTSPLRPRSTQQPPRNRAAEPPTRPPAPSRRADAHAARSRTGRTARLEHARSIVPGRQVQARRSDALVIARLGHPTVPAPRAQSLCFFVSL